MLRPDDVLVTTADHLEGYEVEAHLDIITVHLVGGPSLVDSSEHIEAPARIDPDGRLEYSLDMGFSHEKLAALDDVLFLLKQKANEMGGNGVVGVRLERTRIDQFKHTRIKGKKGPQLLITATGTAVRVRKTTSTNGARDAALPTASAEGVAIEVKKQKILSKLEHGTLPPPIEIDFLTDYRVHEAAPYLIRLIGQWLAEHEQERAACHLTRKARSYERDRNNYKRYFMRIEAHHAKDVLYPAYVAGNDPLSEFALEVLRERCLFDAKRIEELLDADEEDKQEAGLRLLELPKSQYVEEDLGVLKRLLDKVKSMAPENTTGKQLSPVTNGAWRRLRQ